MAVTREDTAPAPGSSPTVSAPVVDPQSAVIVDIDGKVVERFGRFPRDAFGLTLSPDGRSIAFARTAYPGTDRLFVRRGARLGRSSPPACPARSPCGRPDGSRIAFQGHGSHPGEDIYVVDVDGGHLRRLTRDPANDTWPAWSPDGTSLVYINEGDTPSDSPGFTPTSAIWTIAIGGGAPSPVPGAPAGVSTPDYSPDGRRIAFGWDGIGVIDTDGGNLRRVSTIGGAPRWSPDGSMLAFTDYDDSWRADVDIFGSIQSVPVLAVRLLDMATGAISSVGTTQVATLSNAPRWLPAGDALFIYRVQWRSGES